MARPAPRTRPNDRRPTFWAPSILVAVAIGSGVWGCATPRMVPLLSAAGIPNPYTPDPAVPLEVVTRSTGVPDPMSVRGDDVVYGDLEGALAHAVAGAAVPWSEEHRGKREGGWQLFVELIRADAERDHERMMVTLGVRATLRSRGARTYLAQTQAHCRDAALVPSEGGGVVIYRCMTRLGRDLAGWLSSVEP